MFGQSAIVHPDGTVLANAGHYEGIALAHIVPFAWQRTEAIRPNPCVTFCAKIVGLTSMENRSLCPVKWKTTCLTYTAICC